MLIVLLTVAIILLCAWSERIGQQMFEILNSSNAPAKL